MGRDVSKGTRIAITVIGVAGSAVWVGCIALWANAMRDSAILATESARQDAKAAAVAQAEAVAAEEAQRHRERAERNPPITAIDLSELLSEYSGNEIRADSRFKGKRVRFDGVVASIGKDITGGPYLVVGKTKRASPPNAQCALVHGATQSAARLAEGDRVTLVGTVRGKMLNVLLTDCQLL
jgi:hypothetical protein